MPEPDGSARPDITSKITDEDWTLDDLTGRCDSHVEFVRVAKFISAKFVGSRFERCRFERMVADSGDWSFTSLRGADLRGSDLSALDPWNASLRAAIITREQAIVLAHGFGLDVRPD